MASVENKQDVHVVLRIGDEHQLPNATSSSQYLPPILPTSKVVISCFQFTGQLLQAKREESALNRQRYAQQKNEMSVDTFDVVRMPSSIECPEGTRPCVIARTPFLRPYSTSYPTVNRRAIHMTPTHTRFTVMTPFRREMRARWAGPSRRTTCERWGRRIVCTTPSTSPTRRPSVSMRTTTRIRLGYG